MVQIIDVIKQLEIVIPTMMAAELLLTSTIKGIFNIKSDLVNTILSWALSLGTAFLFVLCNGLDFGLGGWNYAVAAVGGLIVAICTNKIYTWEKVKAALDAITDFMLKHPRMHIRIDATTVEEAKAIHDHLLSRQLRAERLEYKANPALAIPQIVITQM